MYYQTILKLIVIVMLKIIKIGPYGQVGKKDFVLVAEEKNNIKCHQIRYDNLATLNVLYILEKKLKI